jgi:hypothetical protein
MRCLQCDYPNPDDHRFCGSCGARLEKAASPSLIDDNDPLEIEAPVYRFEDRSQLRPRETTQIREKDRERELLRDTASKNGDGKHQTNASPAAVESLPHEIIEPTDEELRPEASAKNFDTGIGGPSFLGLSYDDSRKSGFIYDTPRDDGFVYDSDGQSPEYLLEDVPRGVSWRAWGLLALLLVGAGLGYLQWRASHHQGPDLASILSRNGATVDPGSPVAPEKSAQPATRKPSAPDVNASASNSSSDAAPLMATGTKANDVKNAANVQAANVTGEKPKNADTTTSEASSSKTESSKTSPANDEENTSETASSDTAEANTASASKPESDAPVAKATKPALAKPVAETEPAKPKTLGDKDPLLLQADKYIRGRGVRQNCASGVNLLRQAVSAGNPAADIKLGALYWSGTCVTQSKVTAYQWFSRAHSMEPKNRWVERSRSSLWAGMNLDERRRASY